MVVNRPSRTVMPRLQRGRGEARKQLDTLPVPCALPPEPEIGRQFLCGLSPVCAHLPDSARHCCAATQAVLQTLCAFRPPWKERRVGQVNGCRYPARPRASRIAAPDRAALGMKARAGLAATNSAKSSSAWVEIKIVGTVGARPVPVKLLDDVQNRSPRRDRYRRVSRRAAGSPRTAALPRRSLPPRPR